MWNNSWSNKLVENNLHSARFSCFDFCCSCYFSWLCYFAASCQLPIAFCLLPVGRDFFAAVRQKRWIGFTFWHGIRNDVNHTKRNSKLRYCCCCRWSFVDIIGMGQICLVLILLIAKLASSLLSHRPLGIRHSAKNRESGIGHWACQMLMSLWLAFVIEIIYRWYGYG